MTEDETLSEAELECLTFDSALLLRFSRPAQDRRDDDDDDDVGLLLLDLHPVSRPRRFFL